MSVETVIPTKLRKDKTGFMVQTSKGEEWYGFSKFESPTPLNTDMTPVGKPVVVEYKTSLKTGGKFITKVSYPSGFPTDAEVVVKKSETEKRSPINSQVDVNVFNKGLVKFLPNDPVRIHVSGILQAVIQAVPYSENYDGYSNAVKSLTKEFLSFAQELVDEKHGVKQETLPSISIDSTIPEDF